MKSNSDDTVVLLGEKKEMGMWRKVKDEGWRI